MLTEGIALQRDIFYVMVIIVKFILVNVTKYRVDATLFFFKFRS